MAVLPIGIGSEEAGGYQIENSLRFNYADSAYLSRTNVASPTNPKIFTISLWTKLNTDSVTSPFFSAGPDGNNYFDIYFANGSFGIEHLTGGATYQLRASTVSGGVGARFRDLSAWYHVVVAFDMTQASGSNGVKLYVNGVLQTLTYTNYVQNSNLYGNIGSAAAKVGRGTGYDSYYYRGYITEFHFVDGQQLTPSDFGEYNTDTNVWQPKAYSGSYGTNGFYLDFGDNSSTTALGYDAAGSNDWTPNNLATSDSMPDTPSNNFCVINPLSATRTYRSISDGNLRISNSADGYADYFSWPMSSGKWYAEFYIGSVANFNQIGVVNEVAASSVVGYFTSGIGNPGGNVTGGLGTSYLNDGRKRSDGTDTSSWGASYTTGDIIGVTLDMDAGECKVYKNNALQGTLRSGLTGAWAIAASIGNASYWNIVNFGQDSSFSGNKTRQFNTDGNGVGDFYYTPPSGFLALCTTNLPEPDIVDGSQYMGVLLYQGNGTDGRSITTGSAGVTGEVNFTPDMVWIKARNDAADHIIEDIVRGVGSAKQLYPNDTYSEGQYNYGYPSSFDNGGYTVGSSSAYCNSNTITYANWMWKANGAGVSNSEGTINSTVSANTTSGFSIVTYTGTNTAATVGHGCKVGGVATAPAMVIIKDRDSGSNFWVVGHSSLGFTSDNYLRLNATSGFEAGGGVAWNNTAPTSTTVSIGNSSVLNASGNDYVMYAFAPAEGFSAFGSYTGNGVSDGPFVYTGFRPRWVMIKRTSSSGPWWIVDSARDTYNVAHYPLQADSPNDESTISTAYPLLDFTANGFKIRDGVTMGLNGSTSIYVYACFAETPFSLALAC